MNKKFSIEVLLDEPESIKEELVASTDKIPKLKGKFKFEIYSNEGPIPHFHIIKSSGGFESCIELFRPKYFSHGSKIGTFTNNQLKYINDFLKLVVPNTYPNSIWKYMRNYWIANNKISNIKYIKDQPDYTQLNNNI